MKEKLIYTKILWFSRFSGFSGFLQIYLKIQDSQKKFIKNRENRESRKNRELISRLYSGACGAWRPVTRMVTNESIVDLGSHRRRRNSQEKPLCPILLINSLNFSILWILWVFPNIFKIQDSKKKFIKNRESRESRKIENIEFPR